jgi:FkbM family methyltransferase
MRGRAAYRRGLERLQRLFGASKAGAGARLAPDVHVELRSATELDALLGDEYEGGFIRILQTLYDPRRCFLDVGANVGFYTVAMGVYLLPLHTTGRVIAFEPLQDNYRRLLQNLEAHDLDQLCSAHDFGLANRNTVDVPIPGESFAREAGADSASLATAADGERRFGMLPTRLARLDDAWPALHAADGLIDLVRLDTEGQEDAFLEGARATLVAHRPTILMEVNKSHHAARGPGLRESFPALLPPDYRVFREDAGRWLRIGSLAECGVVDNVLLIPAERLELPRYASIGNRAA